MIDLTHTKRHEFIQLVLTIAVVCLALGAITPSVSAAAYDWEFSIDVEESGGNPISLPYTTKATVISTTSDGWDVTYHYSATYNPYNFYTFTAGEYLSSSDSYSSYPILEKPPFEYVNFRNLPITYNESEFDYYARIILNEIISLGLIDLDTEVYVFQGGSYFMLRVPVESLISTQSYPFYVDVVDSGTDYHISVSGFDGTQLAGSAYTISVSTFTGGYKLPMTSFPMYQGDSPVHVWDSDETFTLPVYQSDGVTPIDYYCVLTFPADPTYTGYQFWWNMTTSGYLDYPFDTTYPTIIPTPTPLIPSDIIPDPDSLNNTVNITGWYQDQGYESNNITAPIYNGIRGWFNENLVPVIDFFLTPTNYVATVISDSAETSTDGISYITEELGSYAAPFNTVGSYVVLLVPEVVWLVVFAALSIGYVILLIRVSTGSIRDTIGRFLGGGK